MLLSTAEGNYTINAMPELDEPPNYWKILCVKNDLVIQTSPPVQNGFTYTFPITLS